MGGPRGTKPVADPSTPSLTDRQIDELEARNGLRQFDHTVALIRGALAPGHGKFYLKPSIILELHREALRDITPLFGTYRTCPVTIGNSLHQPPSFEDVPRLVEDMCDYVNSNWERGPLHLAAYVMWRLNWIHPFVDGNGRTTRVACYLVLCVCLQSELPGVPTVPEIISQNKEPYYQALDAADAAERGSRVDVSQMEAVLKSALASQLLGVVRAGEGGEKRGTRPSPQLPMDAPRNTHGQRKSGRVSYVAIVAAIIAAIATIGAAVINSRAVPRCQSGQQNPCSCDAHQQGFAYCGDDGKWLKCECSAPSTPPTP